MSNISLDLIKQLREQSGAGMMACKEALTECNGDLEKAAVVLRKKGLADIQKRSAKTSAEGVIGHYVHAGSKLAVLVEVNCETDFVSRGEDFKKFATDVAMHIAAMNPQWISRNDVPADVYDRETEIILSSIGKKPPDIMEKIVKGRMNKFYKEVCLLDQPFVRDPNITVSDLLGTLGAKVKEKIEIKRFVRFVANEE